MATNEVRVLHVRDGELSLEMTPRFVQLLSNHYGLRPGEAITDAQIKQFLLRTVGAAITEAERG